MRIILASKSPRRKELLSMIVPNFDIIVSDADEVLVGGLKPFEQAMNVSYQKAKAVLDITSGDRIIIGSDTMVVKDNVIYGKPKSKENAKQIIHSLLGGDRTHKVITGVCIFVVKNGECKEYKTYDESIIHFKDISDSEIDKWIETGKAMDKAGAYSIQDEFGVHIDKINGNYSTIVGLPTHIVYDILKEYLD